MKVNTTRFGVLEINDSSVITMPNGPLGFDSHTRFLLLQDHVDARFRWLQSIDEPSLAFAVVDPSLVTENYEVEIPDGEAEKLHLAHEGDAMVLAILTLEEGKLTANLAAPVIINSNELIGAQVVGQDHRYAVDEPLSRLHRSKAIKEKSLKAA